MGLGQGKPTLPVEQKVRIVLSVLAGEITMAEAARRHGVSYPTRNRLNLRLSNVCVLKRG